MLAQKPELRYGCPAADQILFNPFYTIGYSYYFRQAKWALQLISSNKKDNKQEDKSEEDKNKKNKNKVKRNDSFRSDYRIPPIFRVDPKEHDGDDYEKGHLIPSADQRDTKLQNSRTFLLSNICPQKGTFNRGLWKKLENEIRDNIASESYILATYIITGPIFDFIEPITRYEKREPKENEEYTIPIPDYFFKCVLTENEKGGLNMCAWEMANSDKKDKGNKLQAYCKPTSYIERRAGILLWSNLFGDKIEKKKENKDMKRLLSKGLR